MQTKKWTLDDEMSLVDRRLSGETMRKIASDMGRPITDVKRKYYAIAGVRFKNKKFKWNGENIARMLVLLKKGYTTQEIALDIGTTKNAVCGKLARLRTKLDIKPIQRVRAKKPLKPRIYAKSAGGVKFDELTRKLCHYPLGGKVEKPIEFCGASVEKGRPYCTDHCAIAYSSRKKASA